MTTLVSGATGFIGARLLSSLRGEGVVCRGLVRRATNLASIFVGDLADKKALAKACSGVEVVFHCAGYAHAFSSQGNDGERLHWLVNFEGTRNLIEAAGDAGVKRFIFLSSVKAMGDPGNECVDEAYVAPPQSPYGRSKLAAEKAVLEIGQRFGMHVVNLRLSMVYGAGGRGNLERMAQHVRRGIFPPLPDTANHRSLVHVDDVVSVIRLVSDRAIASGRTYIVTHPVAPSGKELFDALCLSQGRGVYKWAVPESVMRSAGAWGDLLQRILQRSMPLNGEVIERLLGSAWYSPAALERELGWVANVSLLDGLAEMASGIGK